jgi:hypothetical protein
MAGVPAMASVPGMVGVLVRLDMVLFGMAAWVSMPAARSSIPTLTPVGVSTVAAAVLMLLMTLALVRVASVIISAGVATAAVISARAIRHVVTMILITSIRVGFVITAVMSHVVPARHVHVHVHVAHTGGHRLHAAPLVTAFGGRGPLLGTSELGDGPAEGPGRLFGSLNQHADARARQLGPHLVDGAAQIVIRLTGDDQQVRVGGASRHDHASPGQLRLHGQPDRSAPWSDRQQSMGLPRRQPGQPLTYDHRSAPSRHAYTTAAISTPKNTNISTIAVTPICATTTAHGYMKSISTSKAKNSSVSAYQRTWNRDIACCAGRLPDRNGAARSGSAAIAVKR